MADKKKKGPLSVAWREARALIWKYRGRLAIGFVILLVGRLAWRWTHDGLAATQAAPSPLTLGLAAVLIVYSLVYLIGLMLQMRRLPATDENSAASGD